MVSHSLRDSNCPVTLGVDIRITPTLERKMIYFKSIVCEIDQKWYGKFIHVFDKHVLCPAFCETECQRLGVPETTEDKGRAPACRADGTMSSALHLPQLIGACPAPWGRKFGGMSVDLSFRPGPFPRPSLLSTGQDETPWEVLRNQSETSSGGSPCPESGARAWLQLLGASDGWALHKGAGLCRGCAQRGTETEKYLVHMPHPHALAEQVDLKAGCFDSAVCNQLGRCQQL